WPKAGPSAPRSPAPRRNRLKALVGPVGAVVGGGAPVAAAVAAGTLHGLVLRLQPGHLAAEFLPGGVRELGGPGLHLGGDLLLCRRGDPGGLGLDGARGLLRGRAVGHLAAEPLDLLVALAARPRAEHEAGGQAAEEGNPVFVHGGLSGARSSCAAAVP